MAKPFKRKASSIPQFRRSTPLDLWKERDKLALLGITVRREVTKSLATADMREAKARQAALTAEWDRRWESWRKALTDGPVNLTDKQQWATVRLITSKLLNAHEERTGQPFDWAGCDSTTAWRHLLGGTDRQAAAVMKLIDDEVEALGIVVVASSRQGIGDKLVGYSSRAVEVALRTASATGSDPLVQWDDEGDLRRVVIALGDRVASGDYTVPQFISSRPGTEALSSLSASSSSSTRALTFEALVDNWVRFKRGEGQQPTAGSQQKYQRQVMRFAKFLGHNEPSCVTVDDAQRYLEHRQRPDSKGKRAAPKQVQDVMHNLSTVYQKAVDARKLTDNPIKPVIPEKLRTNRLTQKAPHTLENAKAILRAARGESDAFRRWGPFLMAYTGMRVAEAGQLRRQDIERKGSNVLIHIRLAAGHTKNDEDRWVPMHQALAEEGFMRFVDGLGSERLFPKACLSRNGDRQKATGKFNDEGTSRLAKWVGSLGLNLGNAAPNHGWRHRFRVAGRTAEISEFALNKIEGRTTGQTGSGAGYENDGFEELLFREMQKVPTIKLEEE